MSRSTNEPLGDGMRGLASLTTQVIHEARKMLWFFDVIHLNIRGRPVQLDLKRPISEKRRSHPLHMNTHFIHLLKACLRHHAMKKASLVIINNPHVGDQEHGARPDEGESPKKDKTRDEPDEEYHNAPHSLSPKWKQEKEWQDRPDRRERKDPKLGEDTRVDDFQNLFVGFEFYILRYFHSVY